MPFPPTGDRADRGRSDHHRCPRPWAFPWAALLTLGLPGTALAVEPATHELAPAMVLEMLQTGASGTTRSSLASALTDPTLPPSALAWSQALAERSEGRIRSAALSLARDGFWFENPVADTVAFFPLLSDSLRRNLGRAGVALEFVSGDLHTPEAHEILASWTRRMTGGDFSGMLPTSHRSQVVFASLVDFRLAWQSPFDPALTHVDRFHQADRRSVRWVDLMAGEGVFLYGRDDLVEVVALPAAGGCDFLLLCPRQLDGLAQVEAALEAGRLPTWRAALQPARLFVQMPRLAFEAAPVVSRTMERAGLGEGVSGFAPASTVADLRWEAQWHELQFGWDESGFRSTNFAGVALAGEPRPPSGWQSGGLTVIGGNNPGLDLLRVYPALRPILANHPFAFALVERASGAVLLRGTVVNPTPSARPATAGLAGFVPDSVRLGADLRHGPTLGWNFDRWFPWVWQEDLGWLWLAAPTGALAPVDHFLAYSPSWGWLQVGVSWRRFPEDLLVSEGSMVLKGPLGETLPPGAPVATAPAAPRRGLWCYAFDLAGWIYLDQESGAPAPAWLLRDGAWTGL